MFQSSPVPKDGCNLPPDAIRMGTLKVSILTRPEGRVQHTVATTPTLSRKFQSSPVPKDGCNTVRRCRSRALRWFQSSPVPKDGCNPCPVCAGHEFRWFQSSPVPKDGCNLPCTCITPSICAAVSILTRPEGRVQPAARDVLPNYQQVSILTRPEGRVQLARRATRQ